MWVMAFGAFLGGILGALWRERRYSAEQIRDHRHEQLRKLIVHARKHSDFWRARLEHIELEAPMETHANADAR